MESTVVRLLAILLCLFGVTGCVQTRYVWKNYDQKLYDHYRNPAQHEAFIVQLKEVVSEAEESGKVPPGIYAEYGYMLYEVGQYDESVKYFHLESQKWPESKVLMAKMVSNAELRQKSTTKNRSVEGGTK